MRATVQTPVEFLAATVASMATEVAALARAGTPGAQTVLDAYLLIRRGSSVAALVEASQYLREQLPRLRG